MKGARSLLRRFCFALFLLLAACRPAALAASAPVATLPHPAVRVTTWSPTAPPVLTAAPSRTPLASPTPEPPTATPVPAPWLCSPLAEHPLEELPQIISDPYHPPPPGKEERHHGVDFSYYRRGERLSIEGVGVQSALKGVVAMALAGSFPYGNVVIVETRRDQIPAELAGRLEMGAGESLYILYAHMQAAPLVALGDPVDACQALGTVGHSGNAGISHLHVETRLGLAGQSFDRMGYYQAQHTQAEKDNYLRWRISGDFRHFDPMTLLRPQQP